MLQNAHAPTKVYVPRPGPASVLLARLHQLGWYWAHGTVFHDHTSLQCDIYRRPVQELRQRVCASWQNRVQCVASERKTVKGLHWPSAALTVANLHTKSAEDQAILRTCLNGTFFTADRMEHRPGDQSVLCPFCSAEDSQSHRHWGCSAFVQCRTVPPDVLDHIRSMPLSLTCHGRVPEPRSLRLFKHVPDTREVFLGVPILPPSCTFPQMEDVRCQLANSADGELGQRS